MIWLPIIGSRSNECGILPTISKQVPMSLHFHRRFRIGVNNKSVISFYENNSRAVSLPVLQMLSEEFGTTLDYLVNGTEPALNEMDPDILMAIGLLKELKTEKGRKVAIEHIRLVGMME